MKRKTFLFIAVLLVAVFAASLCACEKADISKDPIPDGGGEEQTVKVSFYVDGSLYGISLCSGNTLAMPEEPVKDGYSFVGWFYDEELIYPFVLEDFLNSDDKTDVSLYAAWNKTEDPSEGGDGNDPDGETGGEDPDEGGETGDGDGEPEDPEVKTYKVTFVMDGETLSVQQVQEGGSAKLPLDAFYVDGNELYALEVDGNYINVVKDETVNLSWQAADDEHKGMFALEYTTLLISGGKLYLDVISQDYPLDYFVMPSAWGNYAISGVKAGAFTRVPHIKTVTLGKYCQEIEWEAFETLPLLESVSFADGNEYFSSSGLAVTDVRGKELIVCLGSDEGELELPVGIEEVSSGALAGKNYTSVRVPEGVVRIGEGAFSGCAFMTEIYLPESLEEIGAGALENCVSLEEINVPTGVRRIGNGAFRGCTAASVVNYNAVNAEAPIEGNSIFEGTGGEQGFVMNIGSAVESIPARLADARGAGAPLLKGLNFGEESSLLTIGAHAFAAAAIESIVIPDSVRTITKGAFEDCKELREIIYRAESAVSQGILSSAFEGAGKDAVFTVGKEVQAVPDYLLYSLTGNIGITSLVFEQGGVCDSIGTLAFAGLALQGEINLPATVTVIGDGAFSQCAALVAINAEQDGAFVSEDGVLYTSDKSTLVAYPAGKADKTYTAAEGADISPYAFAGAKYLESVKISAVRVGILAFYNCVALEEADFGERLEDIDTGAFSYCGALLKADLPSSLLMIGENAFIHCDSLTEVYLKEGLAEIGSYAFAYCGMLGEVEIPASVVSMGSGIFDK